MSADLAAAVSEESEGSWVSGVVIFIYSDALGCVVGYDEIYVPWFAEDWPSGPPPVGAVVKIDESEGQLRASSLLGTRPAGQVGVEYERAESGLLNDFVSYRDPAAPCEVLSAAVDGRLRVQTRELVLRRYSNTMQDEGIVLWGRQPMNPFDTYPRLRKLRIALADTTASDGIYGRLCDQNGNDVESGQTWTYIGSISGLYRPGRARAWQMPSLTTWITRLSLPNCHGIRLCLTPGSSVSKTVRVLIGTYGSLSLYPLDPTDDANSTAGEITDA